MELGLGILQEPQRGVFCMRILKPLCIRSRESRMRAGCGRLGHLVGAWHMNALGRLVIVSLAAIGALAGCGSDPLQTLPLPDQLIGVDGQMIFLEDLEAISDDNGLSNEAKIAAFQELGLEDPDLIEALLTL